jgi:Flp pilus assembly protein TadB
MAKHVYDKTGKYKGKILSDKEHTRKKYAGSGGPLFAAICLIVLMGLIYYVSWKFALVLTVWLIAVIIFVMYRQS